MSEYDYGLKSTWDAVVGTANHTRKILNDKPSCFKIGYVLSPGGVLNAYREGDLNFTEAASVLQSLIDNGGK